MDKGPTQILHHASGAIKRVISLEVYRTSILVMSTIKGFRFHKGGRIRSHSSLVYVRHSTSDRGVLHFSLKSLYIVVLNSNCR